MNPTPEQLCKHRFDEKEHILQRDTLHLFTQKGNFARTGSRERGVAAAAGKNE